MFHNAYLKLANALSSPLRRPPSLNFKRFFSPISTSRPFFFSQQPFPTSTPKKQRRNFFGFSDILSSKKSYNGHKVVGYTQKQLYDVVSNIDEYHLFIPYCTNSEVLKSHSVDKRTKILTAALGVGFKGFSETYLSEVTCERPRFAVASSDALFSHLISVWQFAPHNELPSTHCYLDFHLEFEFTSPLHAQVANVFFDQVSALMIDAFEERCNQVYGPPAPSIEDY
ncbi:14125_t:CDS:2 [Funneliformis caledonium]|uniref:14125_t:CDS:1 n=1 Tax=Funneliformis caledonium TaxID=1117310 RepID=A0A9N9DW33_9GLOM|nr:14125_t:CDS:2 [Funneliformis caledonium]